MGEFGHFAPQDGGQLAGCFVAHGAHCRDTFGHGLEGVCDPAEGLGAAIHFKDQMPHWLAPQATAGIEVLPRRTRAHQKVFGHVDLCGRRIHDLHHGGSGHRCARFARLGKRRRGTQGKATPCELAKGGPAGLAQRREGHGIFCNAIKIIAASALFMCASS